MSQEIQDEREQAAAYSADDDPIVGLRTRALLNSEPGHHPSADKNIIDPQSFLGQMVARMNSTAVIPEEASEKEEIAFYNRLREEDDLPPSDTFLSRPSIAEIRKTVRERLHPLVENPIETIEIPLDKISDDDFDLRSTMDPDDQSKLVASIATSGLINALTVRRDEHDPDLYHLINGGHRLAALRTLKKTHARCTVRGPLSERDILLMNLGENFARRTLTSFQLASQIELIVRKFMLKPAEIAGALGLSEVHVRSFLRYLSSLPADVISDWRNAHPALTHRMLARIAREPFPSQTWQQIRSRSEIAECAVPNRFKATQEDLDETGWEPFRRPTRAKLARLRDIVMRAKLPADPEKLRKILVGLVDWTRGAERTIPYLLVPTLKDRPKPRRLAQSA